MSTFYYEIKHNKYRLKGYKSVSVNDMLNIRKSGEYVKFNDKVYRIINIARNNTKIIATQYVATPEFDTSNSSLYDPASSSNIGCCLNNDWYNILALES